MISTVRNEIRTAPVFMTWMLVLGIFFAIGLASAGYILWHGLEVTNLTNEVPWGLWITVDLTAIALGAGAFSLSALAYIFRVDAFRRMTRLAVFVGLVGYVCAMMALAMDIGRPDRFWHPLVYWNIHSVLWEITICVILYSTVLGIEFAPIVADAKLIRERFPWAPKVGHFIHRFAPLAAVVGLGLSLLHQSSLGATYGVLVARPIWFKPSLPVMFILSAVGAGVTFTLGLTILYENLVRQRKITSRVRNSVALFGGLMTLGYLYLKLWDFLATNYYSHLPARVDDIALLNRVAPYGTSFWIVEVFLGALVPAIILLSPALRKRDLWVLVAAGLAIAGMIVNRWNVTLSGLIVPLDWSPGVANVFPVNAYRPNMLEWGVAVGIVAFALSMFSLGLRYLPMFPDEDPHH